VATGVSAAALGKKITSASDTRVRLLDRGMLTARPGHVESSVPGLLDYSAQRASSSERARPTTHPTRTEILTLRPPPIGSLRTSWRDRPGSTGGDQNDRDVDQVHEHGEQHDPEAQPATRIHRDRFQATHVARQP
jgi:hypothetical protein